MALVLLNKNSTIFLIITINVLLIVVPSFSQVQNDQPRQVLGTTGGSSSPIHFNSINDDVTFDYTVGEFMVITDSSTSMPSGVKWLTQGFQQPDTLTIVIEDLHVTLHIYKGITPNNDGHNDTWEIDGITEVPGNKVSIYNRWGTLVWEAKNYNNADVVWDGKSNFGKPLPDATYFYIIVAGKKSYDGWVELTH